MKVSITMIAICLALFFLGPGCSQEEQPPVQKTRVTKRIEMPAQEEVETPVTVEEAKPKPEKTEEEKKEETEEKGKEQEQEEVKTAAVEEKTQKPPQPEIKEKEAATEPEAGYYIVKKGDSLAGIAGKEDVYGDRLKWPVLYRFNMDRLGNFHAIEDFPYRELPAGVRKLKIVTSDEARKNLKRRTDNLWVVNVFSTTSTRGRIVSSAARLIKNGYPVYITSARVKGKEWKRLRVGFFGNRSEAAKEAKKMMAILNLVDSWLAKIVKKEFEEFGGY
jgi:hypothetical protein